VANFFLQRRFDPRDLREAINGNLDRDIRALEVRQIDDSFNARFSAKLKTYRYQIWTGQVVSPFIYRYVYHNRGQLDVEEMRRAASALVGAHDFSAFTVMRGEIEDRVRSLTRLDVEQGEDCIKLVAEADGFLRYMVRTIAGTLIEVGRGRRAASGVTEILRSRNRSNAGPTAPAAGLTLVRVGY
jgi:tRNA pseudouridine38-40 synthase